MNFSLPLGAVYARLSCLPVPTAISYGYFNLFKKWCKCSGIEWAVARAKAIKQDILRLKTNPDQEISASWVKRKSKTQFAGLIGSIQKLATGSDKQFKTAIRLLNVYTVVKSDVLLQSQYDKFVNAVTGEGTEIDERYFEMYKGMRRWLHVNYSVPKPAKLYFATFTKEKRKKFWEEIFDSLDSDLSMFQMTRGGIKYVINPLVAVMPEIPTEFSVRPGRSTFTNPKELLIGEVHCSQQPGLKARFYASPKLWVQEVLRPFGKMIYRTVKQLPWDCTFERFKGVPKIQEHLRSGKKCYCYDLSSATDEFPWYLQLEVLRELYPDCEDWIAVYSILNTMPWNLVVPGYAPRRLVWVKGQPLGLFPSFGTFTLSHGCTLFALNEFKWGDDFYILGDDLIILDQNLADKYERFLVDCNIPFQPSKTIISEKFAEFAGVIITPHSVIENQKWKPVTKVNQFEFLKSWGTRFYKLVKPKDREAFEILISLPEPVGLGYNPKGLSFEERAGRFAELFVPRDADFGVYPSKGSIIREHINVLAQMPDTFTAAQVLSCYADELEQSSYAKIKDSLPQAVRQWFSISNKNLAEICNDFGLTVSKDVVPRYIRSKGVIKVIDSDEVKKDSPGVLKSLIKKVREILDTQHKDQLD